LLQAFEQPRRRAERELDANFDPREGGMIGCCLRMSARTRARGSRSAIGGAGLLVEAGVDDGRVAESPCLAHGRVAVPGESAGPRSWWRGEFLGIREAGREVSVAKAVLCDCAAALLQNELQGAHRKIRNFGVRMRTTFTHERSPRRFASRRSRS